MWQTRSQKQHHHKQQLQQIPTTNKDILSLPGGLHNLVQLRAQLICLVWELFQLVVVFKIIKRCAFVTLGERG
eukprot:m.150132 g.150132  ORF g.150132 m.150132 type:complete len:73 (-) comp24457_c0_seq3:49-267(-)